MTICNERSSDCRHCPSLHRGLFSGLTTKELALIEKHKTLLSFEARQNIFEEGLSARGLYCVQSGKIKLYKTDGDQKHKILKIAQAGDLLGDSSLFLDQPHRATAEALEECHVCFWDRTGFLAILKANPTLTLKIIGKLSAELNDTESQLLDLAYQSVRVRFSKFLLTLQEKFGALEEKGYRLDISLSRQELAEAIGTTEETVVRLLGEFRKEGLIEVIKKTIWVIEVEKLMSYTQQGY